MVHPGKREGEIKGEPNSRDFGWKTNAIYGCDRIR